jgi:hypothetical protein
MAEVTTKTKKLDKSVTDLENFSREIFGMDLYQWQIDAMKAITGKNGKSRVAVRAANGSGKTTCLAAPAALWHALIYPNSITITTSGVYRQVKEQMWPCIRSLAAKVKGWGIQVNQTDLVTSTGSRIIGFSTDDPGRFEGWHADNLMIIIDEAKTVADGIFEAVARCQPTRQMVISSPGGTSGEFYRIFNKQQHLWSLHKVTSYDCPHISKEWIEEQFERWGRDHPLIKSMVFGEFMEADDERLVIPWATWDNAIANPPRKSGKDVSCGVDFAGGGDENAMAIRRGNKVEKIVTWRDRDTMASVGRFIMEFKKEGLKEDQIYCDVGGLGLPMADALAEAGWNIHRVNFGGRAQDSDAFVNRSAEMWFTVARLLEKCEIIMPDDDVLAQQLTQRRCSANKNGKLNLESKSEMKARGLSSPDRADAVVMAVAAKGQLDDMLMEYVRPSLDEVLNGSFPEDSLPDGMDVGL